MLLSVEAPGLAQHTHVLWVRKYYGTVWGAADKYGPEEAVIYLCESKWAASTQRQRADTIAHEVAHVVVWDLEDEDHGPKWEACFARMLAIALDIRW